MVTANSTNIESRTNLCVDYCSTIVSIHIFHLNRHSTVEGSRLLLQLAQFQNCFLATT
jgi:hypothetical protein